MGPLLIPLCINNLSFALKTVEVNMYADDTMISSSSETLDELQIVLNAEVVDVDKWLKGNKLSLKHVKTLEMIVGSTER